MKGLIFTYALTYGGALISLTNPYIGLLIYICFAIIKPPALWFFSVPLGNYDRIIAIAMLIGWVLQGCGNWQLGRARVILVSLFGYYIWNVLSAIQGFDQVVG